MARLVFPNGEDRLFYQTGLSPGAALLNTNGIKVNIYLDEACTTLANILNADGSTNAGSQLVVDSQSQLPLFQGPVDGTDTLYVRVDATTGNGYRIHARYDDRVDLKANDAAVVHKAGGDTITASAATVIPLVVKGAVSQTADMLSVVDSTGAQIARIASNGRALVPVLFAGTEDGSTTGQAAAGSVRVVTTAANLPGIVVRGLASQTGRLAEFQDSAGTHLASIDAAGNITSGIAGAIGQIGARLTNAGSKGLVVRGAASQAANLAEFQSDTGAVLTGFNNIGRLVFNGTNIVGTNVTGSPVGALTIVVDGTARRLYFY